MAAPQVNAPAPPVKNLKTAAQKIQEKYSSVKEKGQNDSALKDGPYVFKLTYEKRGIKTLAPSQVVWDPVAKRSREMRVIAGEVSIFKDEQKIDEKSVVSGAIDLWRPEFYDGFLTLTFPQDAEKIQYMFLREDYASKEKRLRDGKIVFDWQNKPVDQAVVLNSAILLKTAMDLAFESATDFESIVPHAKFLGIKLFDQYNQKREEGDVVSEYIRVSQADPALFIKTATSPVVKVAGYVEKALSEGDLIIDQEAGIAKWRTTGAIITQFNNRTPGARYLAEWALSDAGEEFLEIIKK